MTRHPLGRNNALVLVCRSCNEETPRAYDASRGYEPPGSFLGTAQTARESAKKLGPGPGAIGRRADLLDSRTPGFVLVRVPSRGPGGVIRDANEARATFAHEPWAADARYLGRSSKWHLFERPTKRRTVIENPLAAIEKWRDK